MTLRGEWGAEGRFLGTPALSRRAPKGPFLIKNPGLPRESPVPLFPPLHQGRAWEMTSVGMGGHDHQAQGEFHSIFLSLSCETGRDSMTPIVQESNLSNFHTSYNLYSAVITITGSHRLSSSAGLQICCVSLASPTPSLNLSSHP